MTSNEKALGLPFDLVPEVFGAGHQGLRCAPLDSVSASAEGCRASLATGDLRGIKCAQQVGAVSAQNEKTWTFTGRNH